LISSSSSNDNDGFYLRLDDSISTSSSSSKVTMLCYGDNCFSTTFIILFCCSLVGFVSYAAVYILQIAATKKRISTAERENERIN